MGLTPAQEGAGDDPRRGHGGRTQGKALLELTGKTGKTRSTRRKFTASMNDWWPTRHDIPVERDEEIEAGPMNMSKLFSTRQLTLWTRKTHEIHKIHQFYAKTSVFLADRHTPPTPTWFPQLTRIPLCH